MWLSSLHHRLVPVDHSSQVGRIRRDAMGMARDIGLKAEDVERAGIVATEIATNISKFGGPDGTVLLRCDIPASAIELIGLDRGPGIVDPERLFVDRTSTVGTLGTGLGAIHRLSDSFALHTAEGVGTVLFARIQARRPPPYSAPPSCMVAAVCVAAGELPECGDGWFVRQDDGRTELLVVDALGHGPAAALVVDRCRETLTETAPSGPEAVLRGLHAALPGTRCTVAMAVQITDGTLWSSGVGNISGRLFSDGAPHRLLSHPGILGQGIPNIRLTSTPFPPGSLLVLHSDGLSQKWQMDDYPGLEHCHPAVIAGVLFRDHVNRQDDCTVLVARAPAMP